ncbi:MAG: hypothetical protein V3U29_04615, partial [Phycisphaeraceae bacterium]
SFDGEFPEVSPVTEPTTAAPAMAAAASAFAAAGAPPPQATPDAVSQIGRPTTAHLAYAAGLIDALPTRIKQTVHEPFGARAVVYALLINTEPEPRDRQLTRLAEHADRPVYDETQAILPLMEQLDPAARLPLVDMAVPALRALSPKQYEAFGNNVDQLVKADQKMSLFEWTLQRILLRHLQPHFQQVKPPVVQYYSLKSLAIHCSTLLSTLAYVGHKDRAEAEHAFEQASGRLNLPGLALRDAQHCGLGAVDKALNALSTVSPRHKRRVLEACAVCISADKQITVREAELFRAMSDALGCPMPPLLPGQPLIALQH